MPLCVIGCVHCPRQNKYLCLESGHLIKKQTILLAALALAVKTAIVLLFVHDIRSWEIQETVMNLLREGEMKYFYNNRYHYSYQLPVYPFCIFLIYHVFGIHLKAILFFNLILSSATVILLPSVMKGFLDRMFLPARAAKHIPGIAAVSVLLFIAHPMISYYAIANIHPFSMDIFLAVLVLFLTFRYAGNPSLKNLFLFSLALGFAVIERPTLICSAIPFGVLEIKRVPVISFFRNMLLAGVFSILFSISWMVRNYSVERSFSFSSSFWLNMWIGTLEESEGTATLLSGESYYSALTDDELKVLYAREPGDQSDFFREKYRNTVVKTPGKIIRMFFVKFRNFWLFRSRIAAGYSPWFQHFVPAYKLLYLTCFLLAAAAVFYLRGKSLLLLSFPIGLSILQSLVYVETRHRILIEPFLILLACVGVVLLCLPAMRTQQPSGS